MTARSQGYREYAPAAALRPYVECYWSRVSPGPGQVSECYRVLPDGCMDIVFNFSGTWGRTAPAELGRVERAAVVGTMTRPLLLEMKGRQEFLGVRFRPGGARAFLGVPAAELTDRRLGLASVWGAEGNRLADELEELQRLGARVKRLEKELLQRVEGSCAQDAPFERLVDFLVGRRGDASVESLSRASGWSRQHLTRIFKRHLGIGPKRFCRIVRFQALLREAAAGRPPAWARTAAELGYCDQAHLIDDFKEFSGLTPTRYLALR